MLAGKVASIYFQADMVCTPEKKTERLKNESNLRPHKNEEEKPEKQKSNTKLMRRKVLKTKGLNI